MVHRRILSITLCFMIAVILCSCTGFVSSITVLPPEPKQCILEGTWRAEDTAYTDIGTLQFTPAASVIGKSAFYNPSYSIRSINVNEYFMYNNDAALKRNILGKDFLFAITVSCEQNFIGEFIMMSDDELITKIDSSYIHYKRVSKKADAGFYKPSENANMEDLKPTSEDELLRSGLFLGIRDGNSYKTYWIASENRTLHPLLYSNEIFLPRKNGFMPIDPDSFSPLIHKLLFIGNDYVSAEVQSYDNSIARLQLLPVDKIAKSNGIKLYDLFGDDGLYALNNAEKLAAAGNDDKGYPTNAKDFDNFGMYRRMGHWIIKARLTSSKNGVTGFDDVDLNIPLGSKLAYYDKLQVPWSAIKDRVPDAQDAFTSPNRDLAVIVSPSKLSIFFINNGKLSDTPSSRLKLEEDSSVIMAEWATGAYMEKWEKSFNTYIKSKD